MDKHHLSVMRCAYLDLYGFMEALGSEGWDENIPAYKTLQELMGIFKTKDPEFYNENLLISDTRLLNGLVATLKRKRITNENKNGNENKTGNNSRDKPRPSH